MPCPATVGKLSEPIGEARRVRIAEATLPRAGSIYVNSLKNCGLRKELAGHGILSALRVSDDSPNPAAHL
jgi:hypothetical protein